MSKLILGCGYLGLRVARLWRDRGERVLVVTRSAQRAERLSAERLHPLIADVTSPDLRPILDRQVPISRQQTEPSMQADGWTQVDTVLWAVGYDRSAGIPMEQVYVDGLRQVLDLLPDSIRRIVYISSTGVYGQVDSSWIDEDSPCHPTREGGRVCLRAEQQLRGHRLGERAVILRLAGIYGPGRLPRGDDLQAGRPLAAPTRGYVNLIHVDDAARVVLAAEALAPLPSLYLVADDEPVQRQVYYRFLAELLHAPPPRFVEPDPADSRAARAGADKRVCNRRMREQLAIELQFPSYREGLAAAVQSRSDDEPAV